MPYLYPFKPYCPLENLTSTLCVLLCLSISSYKPSLLVLVPPLYVAQLSSAGQTTNTNIFHPQRANLLQCSPVTDFAKLWGETSHVDKVLPGSKIGGWHRPRTASELFFHSCFAIFRGF